jgi:hypothetical protein
MKEYLMVMLVYAIVFFSYVFFVYWISDSSIIPVLLAPFGGAVIGWLQVYLNNKL